MKEKIIYMFIKAISKLPYFMIYALSDFLSFFLIYIVPYRKKVILKNLRNSFPEKSEDEIRKLWKTNIKGLSDQILEVLKLFSADEQEIKNRLHFDNPELIQKYIDDKRTVIVAMGHFANWEYFSILPKKFENTYSVHIIYQKLKNKFFNQKIYDVRSQFGINLLEMKESVRMIKELDYERSHLLGFLFDQSPHKSKVSYDLQFLNQTTPVHLGAEFVSKMKDAVVVMMNIERSKRGYYSVDFSLITDTPKETEQYEITHKLYQALEVQIKSSPDNYLWSHNRWKYKRGIHYFLPEKAKK
jgi:KDO2-lipid IV(A) lauroyltransferase